MRKSNERYGLGNVIKRATSAIGIKPCKSCKERAEVLNEWSRRNFLWRGVMSLVIAKTDFFRSFVPAKEAAALTGLEAMRQLLTTEHIFYHFDFPDTGSRHRFPRKAEMLGNTEPGLGWLVTSDELNGMPNEALWRSLAPNDRNGEILAGWIADIYIEPQRFVIILSQKVDPANPNAPRDIFVSDNNSLIYRVRVYGPEQPAASSLAKAADFPGAIPFNLYSAYEHSDSKLGYIAKAISYRLRGGRPVLSACWNGCTGIGGCGGTCSTQNFFCPCPNPPCDPASPTAYPCYAGLLCGATDCLWCLWQSCDASDCANAQSCKSRHPGWPGQAYCCICPKCHVHCN